jgi:hypothetical protein
MTAELYIVAWSDENVMAFWSRHTWKRPYSDNASRPRLLVADVHRAQTTDNVKKIIADECNTSLVLVPPGCTSLVQPLDVAFNKDFKAVVEQEQTKHMHANMELYASSKITAQDRQILITRWVGTAWSEVSSKKELSSKPSKSAESETL